MALVHNLGPIHQRRKSSSEIVYGIEDFPLVKPLGEGSYSSVYLASHRRLTNLPNQSEELVVVKKVNKSKSQAHFLHAEKEAGRRLHFPHIAEVRANFEDTEHFYFVMNYINGIDLYKFFEQRAFEPFSELRARRLFKQLVEALSYAQKRNVSHRDLKLGNFINTAHSDLPKLENIMITNAAKSDAELSNDEKLVIIDWGLCGVDEESKSSNRWVGSPDYVCPVRLYFYSPFKLLGNFVTRSLSTRES